MTEDVLAKPVDIKDKSVDSVEAVVIVGDEQKVILPPEKFEYAGFGIRLGARIIDIIIIAIVTSVIVFLLSPLFISPSEKSKLDKYQNSVYPERLNVLVATNKVTLAEYSNGKAISDCGFLFEGGENRLLCEEVNKISYKDTFFSIFLDFVLTIVYFVLPAISGWQGSIGKKLLKLKITNFSGQKINLLQSFAREVFSFIGTFASVLFLIYFNFWILFVILAVVSIVDGLKIIVDKKKKSLHDDIAQTFVLKNSDNL